MGQSARNAATKDVPTMPSKEESAQDMGRRARNAAMKDVPTMPKREEYA